jgi:GT2 family glycosyltransferase
MSGDLEFHNDSETRDFEDGDLAHSDLERLQTELRIAQQEIKLHRRQLKEYEKAVYELTHSTSWRLTKPLRALKSLLRAIAKKLALLKYIPKFIASVKEHGWRRTFKRSGQRLRLKKRRPIDTGFELSVQQRQLQSAEQFGSALTISVLVPLYNTNKQQLSEMIDSVQAQTYANWELCLADASDEAHQEVGEACMAYAQADRRIRYQKLEVNEGISGNTNQSLALSSGEYLALLDHDDILHPSALYESMRAISEQGADFIYSDEADFYNYPQQANNPPHYKPDFSPDTLRSYNYICHLMVFSRELLQLAGPFRSVCDGSQDYDMALRLSEQARRIVHIPKVLYYWRKHGKSYSQDMQQLLRCVASAKRALTDHLQRVGLTGEVEDAFSLTNYRINYALSTRPLVSIIIPNKDHIAELDGCLRSILSLSTYENLEILVVENNSTEAETFSYYEGLRGLAAEYERDPDNTIRLLSYSGQFNFSAINNFAAQAAKGDMLLFLNNDTEVITPAWIEEMLMFAQRDDVAAVGAKLLYPDNTIQHAGVVVGIGGVADHIHRLFERSEAGFYNRLQLAQDISAVTGACLMLSAQKFQETGGFDESFAVAFNDIDLCLKLREAGYLNIYTPYAELYHHESKSRGYEDNDEKRRRFADEIYRFNLKWEQVMEAGDPYYNPNLSKERGDFSLAVDDL